MHTAVLVLLLPFDWAGNFWVQEASPWLRTSVITCRCTSGIILWSRGSLLGLESL